MVRKILWTGFQQTKQLDYMVFLIYLLAFFRLACFLVSLFPCLLAGLLVACSLSRLLAECVVFVFVDADQFCQPGCVSEPGATGGRQRHLPARALRGAPKSRVESEGSNPDGVLVMSET